MCIHELSECAWCPSDATYVARGKALSALMERPALTRVLPLQEKATIVPAPSTDDFTTMDVGYESTSLKYTKQVPRLAYNHWAVTTDEVVQDAPLVEWYERTIYGERRFIGLFPKGVTPAMSAH